VSTLRTPAIVAPVINHLSSSGSDLNNSNSLVSEANVIELLAEFSRFEELLLNSPRLPLTGKTIVSEDELLEQMDFMRSNLPPALQTAHHILQRDQILRIAEQQAQQYVATAHQQAFQIANELGIIDRAQAEAHQIRQSAQSECEQLRHQTLFELDQCRAQYAQDIELVRQQSLIECQDIQQQADAYADQVLQSLEGQLCEIHAKIRRGRQHLNPSLVNSLPPN
jgi:cell division septum initiation protein DivIVA